MKFLRLILVILFPVMAFVACQKSEVRPSSGCQGNHNTEASAQNQAAAKSSGGNENNNPGSSDIYGSGDDDRDGGDKKNKKR